MLVKLNPKTTTKDIILATGLTRRGVEYQLGRLKEMGQFERIGSTKAGSWKLKN